MKKKIILMLSRVFPATHSRRGEPTGFVEKVFCGAKIHTIRSNYDMWKLKAEKMEQGYFYLSIRQWSDKPYRSPQVEKIKLFNIGVQQIEIYYHAVSDDITAKIDGKEWLDVDTIAKNDGLSVSDFKEWFFGKDRKADKVFKGVIIHFTDFRY